MTTSTLPSTTAIADPRLAGSHVAMVGAGQLARMTHQAAINLGINLRVLATGPQDPAVRAGATHLIGSPTNLEDLRELATGAEVITFDHERIPQEHLHTLEEEGIALAPSASAALLAQDKLAGRRALAERGFPIPDFVQAETVPEIEQFAARHGWPLVAKAPRGAYDGRGVWELEDPAAATTLLETLRDGLLLEPKLTIESELAVLVARSRSGQTVAYGAVQTIQKNAMCREILAPAPIDQDSAVEAQRLALAVAQEIQATGVIAIEMFLTPAGLLVNELALRPHNSGHYTIEGCATSQFEQHLRAVLDWPLGLPTLLAPAVATVNVIGASEPIDPRTRLDQALAAPAAHIHLYDKEPRPGRKLGHVTVCGQDLQSVRTAARLAAAHLEGHPA